MTPELEELKRLAEVVKGWSNCNKAWLDTSEDESAAVVGHINEDGCAHPVATIDCDQYYAGQDSLPLAKFIAAANPSAILDLLRQLEEAQGENERLRDALICCRAFLGDPANFDCYSSDKELAEFLQQVKRDESIAIEKADAALSKVKP